MKRTVTGRLLNKRVEQNALGDPLCLIEVQIMKPQDGIPSGEWLDVSWDEPVPKSPCEHVSFNEDMQRFQYIVDILDSSLLVGAYRVWVNYCPVCGVRCDHA